MRKILAAIALALMLAPIAVSADPPPAPAGPPTDVRAKMEAARADAKAVLIKALSPDHLTKVQASIDQFNAGTLPALDTIKTIDAVLSPSETKSVLDIQARLNETRRGLLPPTEPSAAPDAMRSPGPGGGGQLDAGRTVLQLLASPDKLRAMRRPAS